MLRSGLAVCCLAVGLPLAGQTQPLEQARKVKGVGDQVYTCQANGGTYAWLLKAPDAKLLEPDGSAFGRHFAGPSWQALDGSTIVAEVVTSSPAPKPFTIPWLVLRVVSHIGKGALSHVDMVARVDTEGGSAPAAGCDAAHAGTEQRVSYAANYIFFPKP